MIWVNGVFRGGAFFRQGGCERIRLAYRYGTLLKTHSGMDVGFRVEGCEWFSSRWGI